VLNGYLQNHTNRCPRDAVLRPPVFEKEAGGLSGAPVRDASTHVVKVFAEQV